MGAPRPRRNGDPRVVLVNTLFWKILVTRVNRKISRFEFFDLGRKLISAHGSRVRMSASGPKAIILHLSPSEIEHPLSEGSTRPLASDIDPRARLSVCSASRISARLPSWRQKREVGSRRFET